MPLNFYLNSQNIAIVQAAIKWGRKDVYPDISLHMHITYVIYLYICNKVLRVPTLNATCCGFYPDIQ